MDYNVGPYFVVFGANSIQMSYLIPITVENILEIDEVFNISIDANSLPLDVFGGDISHAVIKIIDDDRKC